MMQILDALAGGERPVNDLVRLRGLAQPRVSKHLRVLRKVGGGRGARPATEDLEAMPAEAGGSAHLYGASSGGPLMLEAAAAGSRSTGWRSTRCRTA
jgi:Bacterial regulatory protein, arsR family